MQGLCITLGGLCVLDTKQNLPSRLLSRSNPACSTFLVYFLPHLACLQGLCTTLGGLCVLDAKQAGRIFYGSGAWVRLVLNNIRLTNGNARNMGRWPDGCTPLGLLGMAHSMHACICPAPRPLLWLQG